MSSTNGSPRYTIGISVAIREQLKSWGELSTRLYRQSDYLAAVREMNDRLEHDPATWGDPLKSLHGMKANLFRRYGPILMVFYAVHDERLVVLVQRVVLTPGSALANVEGGSSSI
jgi:hypothetical protein